MSTEKVELSGEDEERGWGDRLADVTLAGKSLLGTRLAILREELARKARLAAKALAAIATAVALGAGALLLLAALAAALFTGLLGSAVLGLLAAVVLFAFGAAIAALIGFKALSRLRPLDFPATREELSRDWRAVCSSMARGGEPSEGADETAEDEEAEDLEERFRAGAE